MAATSQRRLTGLEVTGEVIRLIILPLTHLHTRTHIDRLHACNVTNYAPLRILPRSTYRPTTAKTNTKTKKARQWNKEIKETK